VLAFAYWSFHLPLALIARTVLLLVVILGFVTYWTMTIRFDNAVSETSLDISAPIDRVREAIPKAIAVSRWKLMDANSERGHFKARIGITFYTWGQILSIDASRIDSVSSHVKVRCEAIAQKYDWGRNDKAIFRFQRELENALKIMHTHLP
jgi:hypothetical protein